MSLKPKKSLGQSFLVDKNIINCLNADNDKGAISLFDSKQKKTEDNIINISSEIIKLICILTIIQLINHN